ncbi:TPA: hypothetical protein DIV45_01185 [Patescibacteria group bacterium]|nr:hypothetical protein [Patescibacteria group bacterium]
MYYTYILYSSKSLNFYYGYTEDIKDRLKSHNEGRVFATAPYRPWKLVFYASFANKELAKDFERYLKTGAGKAFAYKRLVHSEALKKDKEGRKCYSVAQQSEG